MRINPKQLGYGQLPQRLPIHEDVIQMPLPAPRLYRWLQEVPVYPDQMIVPSMNILKSNWKGTHMTRLCCIAIDEMSIDPRYCYDHNQDRIFGGEKNVTVITVRGLCYAWKQVIYFTFDSSISAVTLRNIIRQLYEVHAEVVSVTSDMGSKNQAMWKELGVGRVIGGVIESTRFKHPNTGNNLGVPDLPHLVKLLRNHTMDNGITIEEGVELNKDFFRDLIMKQNEEFKLTFKLTHKHINCKGKQRQAVGPAFNVFSRPVAEAATFIYPHNETKGKIAAFIQLVSDFCDLTNCRSKVKTSNPYTSPYGTYQAEQDELLERAFTAFSTMVVGQRKRRTYAPFQKGLLMFIISLRGLLNDVKQPPANAKFVIPKNMNQDLLENSFSRLRSFGGFHQNPNAAEVGHRIKKLLLSWNFVTPRGTPVAIEPNENDNSDCITFIHAKSSEKPPCAGI
ncbi:Transposable element P transposase [Orchesella cincta]|uniref:Transposable element P transposase n=1 Tax=Orchesella cincta TaxID=48709 RepID=A0A1D2M314_ORCCI|nr:Transposable element P transposase [Orchesella cincta]